MNKVMLIGNAGADPKIYYYAADEAVAQLPLYTTERGYTLPNGTRVPDRSERHNVVFYKTLAKYVETYVRKGDKLYVEGKLRYRVYDDKAGRKQYVTEILVDTMEKLSFTPATPQGATAPAATTPQQPAKGTSAEQNKTNNDTLPF